MRKFSRKLSVLTTVLLALAATSAGTVAAADPSPPFIPRDADWLTTVNYYRSMSGLSPVTEDPALSAGAYNHSCYMLQNGISHDEVSTKPGYTPSGASAGSKGNVAVSSAFNERARSHIELWMTGPFHAVGILRPNLTKVGFGKCDDQSTPTWHSGATLEVISGLQYPYTQTDPILFPGNGTTTNLNRFVVESPDPLPFCGWSGTAGLPIMALMPESAAGAVSASVSGPSGPIETCALNETNTSGTASQLLKTNNVVVAMPRTVLTPGVYTVTVNTPRRTITWSFTVDPAATADGIVGTPTPTTTPAPETPAPGNASPSSSTSAGLQPITPVRLVDTREDLGATSLQGQASKRIQIGGRAGIPANAPAISANFTVTQPAGGGYLTVWNCASNQPVVATLNFAAGDTVANAASVPLDSTGGLCVYSPVDAELVVDVNGYYSTTGPGKYTTIPPARLMDSRISQGVPGRISGGASVTLQVTNVAGVPANASAVTLNVASVDPSVAGFVTVWPCDAPQPNAASLNPVPGKVKPNLVVAPVAADGTVCFYSSSDVDLVVDVMGYLSTKSTAKFTPSTPFRFTDTRDKARVELNAGTGGAPVPQGTMLKLQIAGKRGIPANATAISANIAVADANRAGFITAWPCGPQPTTANVNYEATNAISNGGQLPLSATGELCIYTMATANIIVDINGWWS